MEHIFFRLHAKIISASTKVLNKHARICLEYCLFFVATFICTFLIYLHLTLLSPSTERSWCLPKILSQNRIDLNSTHVLQLHVPLFGSQVPSYSKKNPRKPHYYSVERYNVRSFLPQLESPQQFAIHHDEGQYYERIYLFSVEKGYLMLNQESREKHGIKTKEFTLNPKFECFGPHHLHLMIDFLVGYDTIIMNWMISLKGGQGYLYNVQSRELANLNHAEDFRKKIETYKAAISFKFGVLFTTFFLFFCTTTLVSFTLRETQTRMFKFTFLLQHHVRNQLPSAPLIFTHVVESLVFVPIMVGILFFLFEFFSDQLLAFMVLTFVWMCEVYSIVSVRTRISIACFPRVFFLYFAMFHIYFFSFPFGFSYLALFDAVLFLIHAMLYFWNRFEIPAFEVGAISQARPRMAESLNYATEEPLNINLQAGVVRTNGNLHNPVRPTSLLQSDPRRNLQRHEPWFPFNLFQPPPEQLERGQHQHRRRESSALNDDETMDELPWPFNLFGQQPVVEVQTDANLSHLPSISNPNNFDAPSSNPEEPWFWDLFVNRPSRENSQLSDNLQIERENGSTSPETLAEMDHCPEQLYSSPPFPFNLFGGGQNNSLDDSRLQSNVPAEMKSDEERQHEIEDEHKHSSPPFPFNFFGGENNTPQQPHQNEPLSPAEKSSKSRQPSSDFSDEHNREENLDQKHLPPPFPFNLFVGESSESKQLIADEPVLPGGASRRSSQTSGTLSAQADGKSKSKGSPDELDEDNREKENPNSKNLPPPFPFNLFVGENSESEQLQASKPHSSGGSSQSSRQTSDNPSAEADGKSGNSACKVDDHSTKEKLKSDVDPVDSPPFPFNLFGEDHKAIEGKEKDQHSDCKNEITENNQQSEPPPFPFNLFVEDQHPSDIFLSEDQCDDELQHSGRSFSLCEPPEEYLENLKRTRSRSLER